MNRPDYIITGDWLAERVDRCTCGVPPTSYGHEPLCGLEQIMKLDELQDLIEAHVASLGDLFF